MDDEPDLGVQFIHAKAAEEGLDVGRIGNKVLLTTGTNKGDRQVETTFWLIGFQRAVVFMSAEVDQTQKDNEAVIDCLNAVPNIIKTTAR